MKYDVTVTGLGDMAHAFLDPAMEMRFVILFNDDAPAEPDDFCLSHVTNRTDTGDGRTAHARRVD